MRLHHEFDIAAPVERVWPMLLDLEPLAPCLPGATAERIGEDRYRTRMSVRLGPVQMSYQGELALTERDEAARRAVFKAKATEAQGQGGATATAEIVVAPIAAGTHVVVDTDLMLTGRVAQMGRGVVDEVSKHLLKQFLQRFGAKLEQEAPPPAEVEAAAAPPPPASTPPEPAAPLNGLALLIGMLRQWFAGLARRFRGVA